MFNLSVKQSFWINFILGVVMAYLFVGALLSLNIIGIALYGVFNYLNWGTVLSHFRNGLYPFHTNFWRTARRKFN